MAEITKAYIEARREAIKWLNSSKRDFNEGASILQKSGYKPIVVSKMLKLGERPHTKEKLEYEIRQMIQVWYNPNDPRFEDVDLEESQELNSVDDSSAEELVKQANEELSKEDDENHYPPVIAKIIYDFKESYNSRSVLHKQMVELGESNAPDIVSSRKVIAASIRALSEKMNRLYEFKERFDSTGKVPSDEEMNSLYADPENDEDNKDDDEEKVEDIASLSIEELKVKKANLKSNLCKAKNMLLYSSFSKPKDGKENLLPDSPKKVKYTKKVEQLTSELEIVEYRLAKIS